MNSISNPPQFDRLPISLLHATNARRLLMGPRKMSPSLLPALMFLVESNHAFHELDVDELMDLDTLLCKVNQAKIPHAVLGSL